MRTPIEILQGDRLFLDSSWEEVSEDDVVKAMESYALQQSESAVREYREALTAVIRHGLIEKDGYESLLQQIHSTLNSPASH